MQVKAIEQTPSPDRLICTAARNDYEKRYVAEEEFRGLMQSIDPSEEFPEELEEYTTDDELPRRMWSLITHLQDRGHFGPFEHPQITFAVEGVSRSLMAQLTRHRLASFDIQSMRYVDFKDANPEPGEAVVEIPALDDPGLTGRNASFADGKEGMNDDAILQERRKSYEIVMEKAFDEYQNLLDLGVPAQDARMVLPIGTKVNMVFSTNARMLMHIGDMRAAGDAQWEIREMTEEVLEKAKDWAPYTFVAYEKKLKNRKNRLAP